MKLILLTSGEISGSRLPPSAQQAARARAATLKTEHGSVEAIYARRAPMACGETAHELSLGFGGSPVPINSVSLLGDDALAIERMTWQMLERTLLTTVGKGKNSVKGKKEEVVAAQRVLRRTFEEQVLNPARGHRIIVAVLPNSGVVHLVEAITGERVSALKPLTSIAFDVYLSESWPPFCRYTPLKTA